MLYMVLDSFVSLLGILVLTLADKICQFHHPKVESAGRRHDTLQITSFSKFIVLYTSIDCCLENHFYLFAFVLAA